MVLRGCVALSVLVVGLAGVAPPAGAAGVLIDGTSVSATEADGTATAEVAVVNTSRRAVTLPSTVALGDTCDASIPEPTVPALQSSTVVLEFDASCFGEATTLKADLDGTGPLPPVTIKKATGDGGDWRPLGIGVLLSLVAALVVGWYAHAQVGAADKARKERSSLPGSAEATARERRRSYEQVKHLVDRRVAQLPPPHGGPLAWKAFPEPATFGLGSEVEGLEAGWSFKDSWASNLTVATAAFAALFSSTDSVKALLGEEPEAALGVMTVSGLIGAVVIAVASTVAKLVGPSTSKVTAGGLVISTALVVLAAALQTFTVGLTTLGLVDGGWLDVMVLLGTIAVAALLVVYAGATTRSTLMAGARDPALPTIPADALQSWDDGAGGREEGEDPAGRDWRGAVVRERIERTYSPWLEGAAGAGAALPIDRLPLVQAIPVREVATRKSLI